MKLFFAFLHSSIPVSHSSGEGVGVRPIVGGPLPGGACLVPNAAPSEREGKRGGKVREWDNMGDGGKIKNYKERQRSGEKVTQEKEDETE